MSFDLDGSMVPSSNLFPDWVCLGSLGGEHSVPGVETAAAVAESRSTAP